MVVSMKDIYLVIADNADYIVAASSQEIAEAIRKQDVADGTIDETAYIIKVPFYSDIKEI